MQVTEPLAERAALWRGVAAGPARFAWHAAAAALLLGVALLARPGTLFFRALALTACLAPCAVALAAWLGHRRRPMAQRLVSEVILPTDGDLGDKALRAAALVDRSEQEGAPLPLALAERHFERLIERAHPSRVQEAARARARRYQGLGVAFVAAVAAVIAFARLEALEGLNVLITTGSRAPFAMRWTERLSMVAHLPGYLGRPPRRLTAGMSTRLPAGTQITLRARALHADRQLVVSDGRNDFPLVSDGEGGLVAHYPLDASATLELGARFGDVFIVGRRAARLEVQPDEPPRVQLDGAPRRLRFGDMQRLELRWVSRDDHGLEQVDLVLRSGDREQRRTLARFDGERGWQQGGYVLLPTEPFLHLSYLPVVVTIEARDNDPTMASKWGSSEAITIDPSGVGAAQAARYLALTRVRSHFVEALSAATRDAPRVAELMARAQEQAREALRDTYDGHPLPPSARSFVTGQLQRVAGHAGTASSYAPLLEGVILALDSALSRWAQQDAVRVALLLAEVAEEAMLGAQLAGSSEDFERGRWRLDAALSALDVGATELITLGGLGHDLGSVARADLGRIRTARQLEDYRHAELAARHLAGRLRRPRASFGAGGGGSGSGGGQPSGGGASAGPGDASAEARAPEEFEQLARQIGQLALEHERAVRQVEDALSESETPPPDSGALEGEAERRAAEVLDAIAGLPLPGDRPGTPRADAALGREHARAMAQSLESTRLAAAAESGRKALASLRQSQSRISGDGRLAGRLDNATRVVERHLQWVRDQVRDAQRAARERARSSLEQIAALEHRLAETARGLEQSGASEHVHLPEEMRAPLRRAGRLMERAARALGAGQGREGLDLQRDAQRFLERADVSDAGPEPSKATERPEAEADGRADGFSGTVPGAGEITDAEAFRRRVLKNLGDEHSGQLAPAIRRYAEGLLR